MSLGARMLNVFAMPGTVFTEVRMIRPMLSNWLVPALLMVVIASISYSTLMSQPAVQQKFREQQEQAMNKAVETGKFSRADADRQIELTRMLFSPGLMIVWCSIFGTIYGFLRVFWWALVLWALARFLLKTHVRFGKALEVSGLAGLIGILGVGVTMLLQTNFGNPAASPNVALLADPASSGGFSSLMLGTMNVFYIWQALVLAVALSRLSDVPFARAAVVFFPFWLALQFAMMTLGASVLGLFG